MPAGSLKADAGAKEAQWFQKLEAAHGPERWRLIELALREAVTHLALVNPFLDRESQERARESQELVEHEEIPLVFSCPDRPPQDQKAAALRAAAAVVDEDEGPLPRPAAALRALGEADPRLLPCCFLSGASVLAALALEAQPGEVVLDLCAGPGAKALALAAQLFGRQAPPAETDQPERPVPAGPGRLVCNEPVRARAVLLKDVLASFLPPDLLAKGGPVALTSSEASHKPPPALQRLGPFDKALTSSEASHKPPPALQRLGPFDKVLVDVPCSALRRMAKQQRVKVGGHLNLVSPGLWECNARTVKANAELAEELLRCAGELVRPGGLVVYCTTSLEERENDGVVKKFLQRVQDGFQLLPGEEDWPIGGAEPTELGTMVLPDQGTLHGPLYFSRLRRV